MTTEEWMRRALACNDPKALRLILILAALDRDCKMEGAARRLAIAFALNVGPAEIDKAAEELKRVGLAELLTLN